MSIRSSDKCSKEIAEQFCLEVMAWCKKNKIHYKKMMGLTNYQGEVRLYNGKYIPRYSKRRVRQYDEGGCYLARTLVKEVSYTSVFRDEWNDPRYQEEEKQAIKDFFGFSSNNSPC